MDNNKQNYRQNNNYQVQYSCCNGKLYLIQSNKRFLLVAIFINLPAILHEILHTSWFSNRQEFGLVIIFIIIHLLNYYCMVYLLTSDPGIISRINYKFDTNETFAAIPKNSQHINGYQTISFIDVAKNQTFRIKLCSTCNVYRPPRASHCNECGVCIERFDHHCYWLGICIGKRNVKHFYLFLITTLLMLLSMDGACIVIMTRNQSSLGNTLAKYPLTLTFCLLSIVPIIFVTVMVCIHTFLLCSNLTTKQYMKQSWNTQTGNPYLKKNCVKNLINVFFKIPDSQIAYKRKKFKNQNEGQSCQSQSPKKKINSKQKKHETEVNQSSHQVLETKFQVPFKSEKLRKMQNINRKQKNILLGYDDVQDFEIQRNQQNQYKSKNSDEHYHQLQKHKKASNFKA